MANLQLLVVVKGGKYGRRAEFRCVGTGPYPEGKVSLARRPDHCFFALNNLQAHDGHAPSYTDKAAFEAYVERVKSDVGALVEKAKVLAPNGPTIVGEWEIPDD